MNNVVAQQILEDAGKIPYSGYDWQLVQTHLIFEDGSIEELWRPGHNTGSSDPEELIEALDGAVERLGLQPQPPIPSYVNPRLEAVGDGGVAMKVILRYPYQENFPRNHHYTLDWILYTSEDITEILPPDGREDEPYAVNEEVARDFMAHFRPYLDSGISEEYGVHDPHAQAVARTSHASITGKPLESDGISPGTILIGLEGTIQMENLGEPVDVNDPPPQVSGDGQTIDQHDNEKWVTIKSVTVSMKGYVLMDENTREVLDVQIALDSASLISPQDKEIQYQGMARMVEPNQG